MQQQQQQQQQRQQRQQPLVSLTECQVSAFQTTTFRTTQCPDLKTEITKIGIKSPFYRFWTYFLRFKFFLAFLMYLKKQKKVSTVSCKTRKLYQTITYIKV